MKRSTIPIDPIDMSNHPAAMTFETEKELEQYLESKKRERIETEKFEDAALVDFFKRVKSIKNIKTEWDLYPPRYKKCIANALKRNLNGLRRWM